MDEETEEETVIPGELLGLLEKFTEIEAFAEPLFKIIERIADKKPGEKVGKLIHMIVNECLIDTIKPLHDQLDGYLKNVRQERLEFIKKAACTSQVSEKTALALVQLHDLEQRYLAKCWEAMINKVNTESSSKEPSDKNALIREMIKNFTH